MESGADSMECGANPMECGADSMECGADSMESRALPEGFAAKSVDFDASPTGFLREVM
jgi:hypothetical protein